MLAQVRDFERTDSSIFSGFEQNHEHSIIRGALLVHDAGLDYLVVDTVDTDMFLWVKEMHLQAGHVVRI